MSVVYRTVCAGLRLSGHETAGRCGEIEIQE